MDNILFALVPALEQTDDALDGDLCPDLVERSVELIDRLKEIVEVEQEKMYVTESQTPLGTDEIIRASAFSSSPVQSVLQKSQHVISTHNQLSYSSVSFSATSWHLHEGKRALELLVTPFILKGHIYRSWYFL